MATLEELYSGIFGEEQEKTASSGQISEADIIEKVASELTDDDLIEAETLIKGHEEEKLADDYYNLGRFMARGLWEELNGLQKAAAGGAAAVTGFGGTSKSGDMVGMTGSAYQSPGAPGNPTIAKGGDTSPGASGAEPGPKSNTPEGQSHYTPQDGSNVLAKIRTSIDAIHQPVSATKKQDAMGVLQKMVDAAKQQRTKQHPSEVPSNLTAG